MSESFWKFNKLFNSGIFLNWSIIDEVTTPNTTAYFFGPLCRLATTAVLNVMHYRLEFVNSCQYAFCHKLLFISAFIYLFNKKHNV